MAVNFKFNNGGTETDFDDVFIRREYFTTGGLWTWGLNDSGQLGDNTLNQASSPVQTISGGTNWKQVSAGTTHTAAVKTDGTLWLWGNNTYGAIGDNTSINDKLSPVQTISGGTNWKQVSAGDTFTAAIKTDGTLWLWGYNDDGQLGNNSRISRSSPVQTISGGTNWKQVSAGDTHTAAIKTDGTLWLWGDGSFGQLGNGGTTSRSSPMQTVSAGTNWKQVSAGALHTAAIKTDGTLWLWGWNFVTGALGDNTTTNRVSPVQTISGGTNWKQVSAGDYYTAAIKTDGTLWLWGSGVAGELGDNTRTNKSSPVQTISGGTNWKQVSAGRLSHIMSIKTDGTLWVWGSNNFGKLGDNTVIGKSSPVQTIAGGTNWKQVSAGGSHSAAIKDEYY